MPTETPTADLKNAPAYRRSPHWFALLAAAFTWPLLFVGGMVTSYRIGMAVPDWPTTFGVNMFLYDMTKAPWGPFGEHAHRLYGAFLGFFTILLMVDFLAFEHRRRMKALGVIALVAVIIQGVLGGRRVNLNSTLLAAVHGVTAQVFFGYMVALCVMTGRRWFEAPRIVENPGKARRSAVAMLALLAVQVVVGAWLRHFNHVHALYLHSVLAFLVLGHGFGMVMKINRRKAEAPELVPAARAMGVILVIQIALGIAAWWMLRPYDGTIRPVTLFQALVRTGHQANAGLLIASSVVLVLRSFGQLAGPAGTARPSDTATRELEAVA